MGQFNFTVARGQTKKDVVVAAGAVVGTDTIQVNFDVTNLTRMEAIKGLAEIQRAMIEGKWPPL